MFKAAKSTNLSPAFSRDLNMPCEISIFDTHDLWHFLSAGFLFFSFLLLLVLDDGIVEQKRTQIRIFWIYTNTNTYSTILNKILKKIVLTIVFGPWIDDNECGIIRNDGH